MDHAPRGARPSGRAPLPLLVALVVALTAPAAARGQTPAPADALAEASWLRDERDFAGAAELLRRHAAAHPEDANAARMLAQTLYWAGDVPAAETRYEGALRRWPEDPWLR
ncbi:MAG TPA: tetratricopeptide repeat protein, partial [Longimicrobiaceae bacterium]|nr:tetratricopeptide repeat protein [Longimicrobiaceae bacterium]